MAFVEVSKQGHVGIVTMNRPETLNALSSAVFADLLKAFDVVENDEEIYVVVVTGAGRSFVAGADISEMATMNVVEGKNFGDLGNQAMLRLERMEKPTIAAINGFALGGGCVSPRWAWASPPASAAPSVCPASAALHTPWS